MRAPLPKTVKVKPRRTVTMPVEHTHLPPTEKGHTGHAGQHSPVAPSHGYEATEKFMETIIKSQQAELITLHETTHSLKGELSASEQRTAFLKDIVKEFSAALASSRAELKDLERHCHALQFEVCCLKSPTTSPHDLKARFDAEQQRQQQQIRSHNAALTSGAAGAALAATIGRELETRALAARLAEARDAVTQQFGEMASLNEEVAAISLRTRRLARENAALERDNAALQQRVDNNASTTGAGSVALGDGGSSEPELLEEDGEGADDSESQHELSSAATTRSSASSEDIGAVCILRKIHVHHELTELRARRLVSGSDLHSSYENIGPVGHK